MKNESMKQPNLARLLTSCLAVLIVVSPIVAATPKKNEGEANPAKSADEKKIPKEVVGGPKEVSDLAKSAIPWAKGFETAMKNAKTLGRPVLVDFGAEWCGWCKKLDRETFGDAKVIRLIRDNFVAVKVDCDKEKEIQQKYGVTGLPTIIFLAPDGKEIQRLTGFRDAEAFLEEARKPVASSKTLKDLRTSFEKNPKDLDIRRAYARAVFALGNESDALKLLGDGLKQAPGNAGILLDLADVHRGSGRYEKAREQYEKILSLKDPKAKDIKTQVYLPFGRLLVTLKDHKAAIDAFSQYLDSHPPKQGDKNDEVWEAYFFRGLAYATIKKADKALDDLRAVRDKDQGAWGLRANYIIDIVETE
ncbi:MAG: thioredoxin fold domain-containing protein [Planctomycetota bacterium]